MPGAHYWEPATPIMSKCNGIFTDQSIFIYFSREIGQFLYTRARFGKDKHCFVSTFESKSRNKNICWGLKKCSALIGWFAGVDPRQVASVIKNEQQSQNLLLNFLQTATKIFVARQVDHARWKTRNADLKLATKQCCATSWGLLHLVFRRL